jgi:hypothetical protein
MTQQTDVLTDELVDDFCYEVAIALRRILDLEEDDDYDETDADD